MNELIEKIMTSKKMEGDKTSLMFVDFIYNGDIDTTNEGVGLNIFTKHIELGKSLIDETIIADFIETINDIKPKTTTILSTDPVRRNISKILTASNTIAVDGRIGPAKKILVSEDNYNKYGLSNLFENFEVNFVNNIDDLILYRDNDIDQPGIMLLYNEEKYSIISKGFFPEHQFAKIELK